MQLCQRTEIIHTANAKQYRDDVGIFEACRHWRLESLSIVMPVIYFNTSGKLNRNHFHCSFLLITIIYSLFAYKASFC